MRMRTAVVMMLMAGATAARAAVLAGWCEPASGQPDVVAQNIIASLDSTGWGTPKQGSGDDTFGTFAGASHNGKTSGSFWNQKTTEPLTFTLTLQNNETSSYALDFLNFDVFRSYGDAPDLWSLNSGGRTVLSGSVPRVSGAPAADESNDFSDVDIDLGSVGLILKAGQTLTLELVFTDSTPEGAGNLFVDNIAVFATPVSGTDAGTVLAGWSEPAFAAGTAASGFRATLSADGWGTPKQGCGDRTFGSVSGAGRGSSAASYWNKKTAGPLGLTITLNNDTTQSWQLESVHFDSYRSFGDAMDQWTLHISGDGIVFDKLNGSVDRISGAPTADENNDYSDVDIHLGQYNLTLEGGKKAVFSLEFSDTTPDAVGNLFVDNIAVVGKAVQ